MSIHKKANKAQTFASIQALIAGTQKHTPSGQLTLGNVAYTAASLVELLQSFVDAMAAQNAAVASAKDALAVLEQIRTKVSPVVSAYRKYLSASYGNATQTLADYGLTPAKAPAPLSVEAKAAKVAKNGATRKARGTLGPKARLKIKGDVATSAPAPAAPAPPPGKPKP